MSGPIILHTCLYNEAQLVYIQVIKQVAKAIQVGQSGNLQYRTFIRPSVRVG